MGKIIVWAILIEILFSSCKKKNITPEIIEITVTRNAEDYNSIRAIIAGITDTTFGKKYKIIVPKGEWFECDLRGKKNVMIVGASKTETIIYCDGNSDKLSPPDYSFYGQANKPLKTIPRDNKHSFFITENVHLENLTVRVNDAKYTVHLDNKNYSTAIFKNVIFTTVGTNTNTPVGIGINGGQSIVFDSCTFKAEYRKHAIYYHNWNNQNEPSSVTIKNSFFENTDYIRLDELGSEQNDLVKLNNCVASLQNPKIFCGVASTNNYLTYWINTAQTQESNPTKVPYSIRLNIAGTHVSYIGYVQFPSYPSNPRPLFLDFVTGTYDAAF